MFDMLSSITLTEEKLVTLKLVCNELFVQYSPSQDKKNVIPPITQPSSSTT